ncbi:hypothetical protein LR48_Vigan07g086900 [Vigna angularis]|uniref:Uncharacterized protein n=1 Tax=Phaseolus angularis TaxID=3914 RepID=A0A0L9UWD0_PHAAN|nr:hypothetical protein LR48_Vigan07g086900 [Vigna angularis]
MKQKSDSRLSLSEGGDPPLPPSPPSRHEKWKLARIKSSGSYTSDSSREISEIIFQQQFGHYGNRPTPSPVAEHVVPPTSRSSKGSCSAAGAPGDDMDDTRLCQEGSPTLKKTHLSEDDPIGALHELVNIIADAPMIVP